MDLLAAGGTYVRKGTRLSHYITRDAPGPSLFLKDYTRYIGDVGFVDSNLVNSKKTMAFIITDLR